jgi:hypothetical protein
MEKISLKLEIMAEAGKPDRLRELAITEFDLGTVVPVLKDCRLVPSDNIFNKSKENMDLVCYFYFLEIFLIDNLKILSNSHFRYSNPSRPCGLY